MPWLRASLLSLDPSSREAVAAVHRGTPDLDHERGPIVGVPTPGSHEERARLSIQAGLRTTDALDAQTPDRLATAHAAKPQGSSAGLAVSLALAALATLPPLQAEAQTISVEDLEAQIDARVGQWDQYRSLLDDPDPARQLAALQLMIESADPVLVRMALEAGAYSPDPAVRQAALEAFFASEPNLDVRIDFSAAEEELMPTVARFVASAQGSVDAEGRATFSWKLGDYHQQKGCYLLANSQTCLARLSGATVSLFLYSAWMTLEPSDDGRLVADTLIDYGNDRLPAKISLRIVE